MKNIISFIQAKIKIFGKKIFSCISKISPTLSCKILFIIRTREIPNLKNPQTFNEKLTKLKLSYKDNKLISKCTDKYEVREFIKSKKMGNILNKLYFVWDSVEDIDFNKLPDKFVLKCTHGSGYNIVCDDKNKFDINIAKNKLNRWLKEKYGLATSELHYLNIKPRIICEKNLCDKNGKLPIDYKFYCSEGKIMGVFVCTERNLETHTKKSNFYDLKWNELPYLKEEYRGTKKIEKPKNLDKMIKYAEKLSEDFKFVRVDFYSDNGKVIFGELTFTPDCSCANYYSKIGNIELGKMLSK